MQTTSHVVYTDLLSGGNISFWNSNVRAQLFWQARKHKHENKYAMHLQMLGIPICSLQFSIQRIMLTRKAIIQRHARTIRSALRFCLARSISRSAFNRFSSCAINRFSSRSCSRCCASDSAYKKDTGQKSGDWVWRITPKD